jgi:hypothetical protein
MKPGTLIKLPDGRGGLIAPRTLPQRATDKSKEVI